ncbi:tandem ph domain containing protein [Anaeramoeba flamelloides]|uniref:Tandem ph domain containing protein n=1 Tax=Anaeramoeba flamelloides TaxID=1746091 RepID=A0AAV8A440_9EUKA|nr:tandem ph domain containing protein [Anaeramoeba flamelloides]
MFSAFTSPRTMPLLREVFSSLELLQVIIGTDFTSIENVTISTKFAACICELLCIPPSFQIEQCSAEKLRTQVLKEKKDSTPINIQQISLTLREKKENKISTKKLLRQKKMKKSKKKTIRFISSGESESSDFSSLENSESGEELLIKKKNQLFQLLRFHPLQIDSFKISIMKNKTQSFVLNFEKVTIKIGENNLLDLEIENLIINNTSEIIRNIFPNYFQNSENNQIHIKHLSFIKINESKRVLNIQKYECNIIEFYNLLYYYVVMISPYYLFKKKNHENLDIEINIGKLKINLKPYTILITRFNLIFPITTNNNNKNNNNNNKTPKINFLDFDCQIEVEDEENYPKFIKQFIISNNFSLFQTKRSQEKNSVQIEIIKRNNSKNFKIIINDLICIGRIYDFIHFQYFQKEILDNFLKYWKFISDNFLDKNDLKINSNNNNDNKTKKNSNDNDNKAKKKTGIISDEGDNENNDNNNNNNEHKTKNEKNKLTLDIHINSLKLCLSIFQKQLQSYFSDQFTTKKMEIKVNTNSESEEKNNLIKIFDFSSKKFSTDYLSFNISKDNFDLEECFLNCESLKGFSNLMLSIYSSITFNKKKILQQQNLKKTLLIHNNSNSSDDFNNNKQMYSNLLQLNNTKSQYNFKRNTTSDMPTFDQEVFGFKSFQEQKKKIGNNQEKINKTLLLNTLAWEMLQLEEQIAKFKLHIAKLRDPLFYILKSLNTLEEQKVSKLSEQKKKNLLTKAKTISGLCYKKGKVNKSWKKRWMILTADRIRYFKHEQPTREEDHTELPLGTIFLSQAQILNPDSKILKKRKNCFSLKTSNRNYLIQPINQKLHQWFDSISFNLNLLNQIDGKKNIDSKQVNFNQLLNLNNTSLNINIKNSNNNKNKNNSNNNNNNIGIDSPQNIINLYSGIKKQLTEMKSSHHRLMTILDVFHQNNEK